MFDVPVRRTPLGSRAMTEEELEQFLGRICYGTISYQADDGWPDSRVLNFVYNKGAFYCHANKYCGEKLNYWANGTKVCINFYEASTEVGKRRFCQHDSVLVYGYLNRVDLPDNPTDEGYTALESISHGAGTPFKAKPERLSKTSRGCGIFRVDPFYMVGKLTIFTTMQEKSYLETLCQGKT